MADCTIVVPCYNEAERLDVDAFRRFAASDGHCRFLLVDDGSRDATRAVLDELCRADPYHFTALGLAKNGGKAEAVRQGMLAAREARPAMVGYWDADLATPLEAIGDFRRRLAADPSLLLVTGARVKLLGRTIERNPLRHYLGRVLASAISLTLRLPVFDTQCGAKLFRAEEEIWQLFERPFQTNWLFDVELLARLMLREGDLPPAERCVYELPLQQWRDVRGSKVRPWDFFRAFYELAVIRRTYLRGFQRRPWTVPFDEAARRAA